jgi:hypothetical protein
MEISGTLYFGMFAFGRKITANIDSCKNYFQIFIFQYDLNLNEFFLFTQNSINSEDDADFTNEYST